MGGMGRLENLKKKKVKSPITYFGGKFYLVDELLRNFPLDYRQYVEVFGGGGSLILAKGRSDLDVYNDVNGDVVNLFRVLREDALFEKFCRYCWLLPYSREEFMKRRNDFYYKREKDNFERAVNYFYLASCGFSGNIQGRKASWGFSLMDSKPVKSWVNKVECLQRMKTTEGLLKRLKELQIEQQDFRKLIPVYDRKTVFFYCDPPYLPDTRKGGKYECEMSVEDHEELLKMLVKLQGKFMLSGYDNELYRKYEREYGWKRKEIDTTCWCQGSNQMEGNIKDKRKEVIWMNYVREELLL